MQPKERSQDIAEIVDTCSFGAVKPDDDSNLYTTQYVMDEIQELANSKSVKHKAGKARKAFRTIKESSDALRSEAYRQIDSVVHSVYGDDKIVESPTVLGMRKSDFAGALSGFLHALGPKKLYNRINKAEGTEEHPEQNINSITITCGNSLKDKEEFAESIRQALLPAIEIGLFEDLGITCRLYDEGDSVITLTDGNKTKGDDIEVSLQGTYDFKSRYNHGFMIEDAKKTIGESGNSELAKQMGTFAYFSTMPGRILSADEPASGSLFRDYMGILSEYSSICSKNIVGNTIKSYELPGMDFDIIDQRAKNTLTRNLQEKGINLSPEQERYIRGNISKAVASAMKGRSFYASKDLGDLSVVAAAYAVPEQRAVIHSDDVDVAELAMYASADNALPMKDITVKTSQRSHQHSGRKSAVSNTCKYAV
ncbi:hypothetical protein GF345_03935 [Candidatus Woesearchaeota archaeon]|nr:hypothetical protein [Candidatus Woesearchaeota archaeon]